MSEAKDISSAIDIASKRFTELAPPTMKYEAEKGFALQLLRNNDYLMSVAQGAPMSLQYAITNVAAIGLSLNPAEKLAYLVPRTVKINGKYEKRIFLDPSYAGLIKLATDSGSIEWAQARCVYEADDFTDNGIGEKPTHQYKAFSKDRGPFVGVYCVAKTKSGDYLTTLMDAAAVLSIRDRSEAWKQKQSGPWLTDFEEMAKKSVMRQAWKTWPKTDERRMERLAAAVNISNENEGFEPILTSPSLGENSLDQKQYFDQLIEKSDALGMYVFVQSLRDKNQDSVVTNLYHSFEKGQKGKYQRIIDQLLQSGESQFRDYVDGIRTALEGDDKGGFDQLASELDQATTALIQSRLNVQERSTFNKWVA